MAKQGNWPGKRPSKLQVPERMTLQSVVSPEDAKRFLKILHRKSQSKLRRFFASLVVMPPILRLRRNLKVLLDRVSRETPMRDFMRDGLTESERDALARLTSIETSEGDIQAIAQGLLNVEERYQLYLSIGSLFDSQRNVAWPTGREAWHQW